MRFPLFSLARKSVWSRKGSAFLTLLSIAFSVLLFVGVEKINQGAKTSFENTISGTDLIVGTRTGQVNLLLYTVFQIGEGMPGIQWSSYEFWRDQPKVAWAVPIDLGDSHRGFRVMGTTNDYFEHYRFGESQALAFAQGGALNEAHSVVVGSEVAKQLIYSIDDKILISHGLVAASFAEHKDAPFFISGILKPTGTPVDRLVIVSLEGLALAHDEADHHDEEHAHDEHSADKHHEGYEPQKISAFLLGFTSPQVAIPYQYSINNWTGEPLMAILPGLTLGQLWSLVGNVEKVLLTITGFVIFVGLLGMMTNILTSVKERRREMAVLRAIGARPRHIFSLLVMEAAILALLGAVLGLALFYGLAAILRTIDLPGLSLPGMTTILSQGPDSIDLWVVLVVTLVAAVLAFVPGLLAYRNSLSDGLTQEG